ncbi:hypothetical protein LTR56_017960, partial [Elasticomyces elasticus]
MYFMPHHWLGEAASKKGSALERLRVCIKQSGRPRRYPLSQPSLFATKGTPPSSTSSTTKANPRSLSQAPTRHRTMQLSKPTVSCAQFSEPERGRTRARQCYQLANTANMSQANRERPASFNDFLSGRGGSQYGGGPQPRPLPPPPAKPEPKVPKPSMRGW